MAVTQPKQRGIRKSVISTKLDDATIAKIDQFAETTDSARSAAVAALIEVGLGGRARWRSSSPRTTASGRRSARAGPRCADTRRSPALSVASPHGSALPPASRGHQLVHAPGV